MIDAELPSTRPASQSPEGKRRGRAKKRHTIATVLLCTAVVLALVTGLGVAYLYRHLNGNLTVDDVTEQLENRPEKHQVEGPKEPLNILVMGSDTRDCKGCGIDREGTGQGFSDTTILFHLSADRKRAYGVSIPRDSLVERPDCRSEDGDVIPGEESAMWNAAFRLGGPACTIQQFEQTTGVRVDNYVVVNFQGFQDMVDAVDGVEMCVPEDIDDPQAQLSIPAGTHVLRGRDALGYVRLRKTVGDGSDIGRIKRQQAFIAAMANKALSSDTLARPDRVIPFLDAATRSITTDFESIPALAKIAMQFQGIGLDQIQFVTVPWYYPTTAGEEGRVRWQEKPAADLWARVARDRPLGKLRSEAISAGNVPGASPSQSPGASGSGRPSDRPSASGPSESAGTDEPSDSASPSTGTGAGLSDEELESAGLCT